MKFMTSYPILALAAFSLMLAFNPPLEVQAVQRDFPSLHITSDLHPFRQAREYWHGGTLTLTSDNPEWNFSNVDVRLRGRGNSTWWGAPEKRPLRIRFETPRGMFGSEVHRDWILLANAFDPSLLRTHLTFYFASLLGDTMVYVPSTQFVHLYINGRYVGVFQITDERDNGPGRGNVRVDADPAVSEFWIEMDRRTTDYFDILGFTYDFRMPSGGALTDAHIDYVHEYLLAVCLAIRTHDWERLNELIDVQSFVDFYIVQEWSKESDVAFSSIFMQILGQGDERRLVMGPLWDFDRSFGNFYLGGFYEATGVHWARRYYWFANLMHIQQFRDAVEKRWADTAWAREAALANLQYMIWVYGHAFQRNFTVQPMFGPWIDTFSPNVLALGEDWQRQARFVVDFARDRARWLDEYIGYQPQTPLLDVHMTHWVYDDVMTVYNAGIMQAWSTYNFAPLVQITGREFNQALFNLFVQITEGLDFNEDDTMNGVPVVWFPSQAGEGRVYSPDDTMTREELVVWMYNFALELGIPLPTGRRVFQDTRELSEHSHRAINALLHDSSLTRYPRFNPQSLASRADAAIVISSFLTTAGLIPPDVQTVTQEDVPLYTSHIYADVEW